jgi:hypothetical protein
MRKGPRAGSENGLTIRNWALPLRLRRFEDVFPYGYAGNRTFFLHTGAYFNMNNNKQNNSKIILMQK